MQKLETLRRYAQWKPRARKAQSMTEGWEADSLPTYPGRHCFPPLSQIFRIAKN